jgi:hypothetical protein
MSAASHSPAGTMNQALTARDFIAKWGPGGSAHALGERAGAQAHFIDLCQLLGVATPGDAERLEQGSFSSLRSGRRGRLPVTVPDLCSPCHAGDVMPFLLANTRVSGRQQAQARWWKPTRLECARRLRVSRIEHHRPVLARLRVD